MHFLLYSAGYFFAILFIFRICKKNSNTNKEKLLISLASIIPLGKLIYFPIPGLMGLKVQFIFASLAGLLALLSGITPRQWILFFGLIVFPFFSVIFLEDYGVFIVNNLYGEDQIDSVLFRLVTLVLLISFMFFVSNTIKRNPFLIKDVSVAFISGAIASCFVGILIFIGIWYQTLSVQDLLPISSDTHVVDKFYRFNPGANVNEFSMILAFSIFMLPLTGYSAIKKRLLFLVFLILEFATLTRASWLALLFSFLVVIILKKHSLNKILVGSLSLVCLCVLFYIIIISNPFLHDLFVSRTSFDIGASGYERLEKFDYVLSRLGTSEFRLFFGYGWSTNLYVHNVYLQILYEVGLLGLLVFCGYFCFLFSRVLKINTHRFKEFSISTLVFIAVCAGAHHTLYHVQTWFMIALVIVATNNYLYDYKCRSN